MIQIKSLAFYYLCWLTFLERKLLFNPSLLILSTYLLNLFDNYYVLRLDVLLTRVHRTKITRPLKKQLHHRGWHLLIIHVTYRPDKGNLIVKHLGIILSKIISFFGFHMDVVTTNPNNWDFDPFSLRIDWDKW